MKNNKVLIALVLVISLLLGLSACKSKHTHNKRTHRLEWWLDAINWDESSRTCGLTGKGVRIAVLDTPIDENHPDLEGKIVEQHYIGELTAEPRYEHGTAVAGVICASPSDGDGVLGIATNAQIVSIVISNSTEASVGALVKGIEYATEQNVDIINISAGVLTDDPQLFDAIEKAYNSGIVIVAAAGTEKMYPASYEHVISVNAIDSNGERLFGNDGDVFLPGGNIVTTYSSVYESRKSVSYTGTSMACPILTGIIALLLEHNAELSNKDILTFFQGYCEEKIDTVTIIEDFNHKFNGDLND